jgi:predicted permease
VNLSFLRREWGAATFVLTVLVGMIIVPLALIFGHHGTSAASPGPATTATASASPSASVSPSPSASPAASPSAAPSPTR